MKRALSIWFPLWPVDLIRRRDARSLHHLPLHSLPQSPSSLSSNNLATSSHPSFLLVVDSVGQKRRVVACCEHALAAGIRPGLPVGEAQAALPTGSCRLVPHTPQANALALRAVAHWARRYSPVVAPDPPDGLLIDLTGCQPLLGPDHVIAARIQRELLALGLHARGAIAPTFAAASLLARRSGKGEKWKSDKVFEARSSPSSALCHSATSPLPHPWPIVTPDTLRDAIDPLPLDALGLEPHVVAGLHEVGVLTIRQLIELPRRLIPARFGHTLLTRLDQLLGYALELIDPLRHREPIHEQWRLEGATTRLEDLTLCLDLLIERLCHQLQTRESGARRLEIAFDRLDLEPTGITLQFTRPTRDPRHIRRLLRPRLEKIHLGCGVEGIRCTAARTGPLVHEQLTVGDPDHRPSGAAIAQLLDTLSARLGPDRVLQATPVETHIPERAARWHAPSAPSPPPRQSNLPTLFSPHRPTILLRDPRPITLASPIDPANRASFDYAGERYEVAQMLGPERISGEWWRADEPTRDYFRVITHDGRWWWICHHIETDRWLLHGLWA